LNIATRGLGAQCTGQYILQGLGGSCSEGTFRTIRDTISVSDGLVAYAGRPVYKTESTSISDAISHTFGAVRKLIEFHPIVDHLITLKSVNRVIDEAVSLGEHLSVHSQLLGSVMRGELIRVSDVMTRTLAAPRTIQESESASDVILAYKRFRKLLPQIVRMSDVVTRLRASSRVLTSSISISDSLRIVYGIIRKDIDQVLAYDSVRTIRGALIDVSSQVSLSDTLHLSGTHTRKFIETIQESSIVAGTYHTLRSVTSSTSISDAVTRRLSVVFIDRYWFYLVDKVSASRGNVRNQQETTTMSDRVIRYDQLSAILTSSVLISDVISGIAGAYRRVLTRYHIHDVLFARKDGNSVLTEAVTYVDNIVKSTTHGRIVTASISAQDVMTRLMNAKRNITEAVNSHTVLSFLQVLSATFTDALSISDSLSHSKTHKRILSATISAQDVIATMTSYVRTVRSTFGLVLDELFRVYGTKAVIPQSVTQSTNLLITSFSGRNLTESIATSDLMLISGEIKRVVFERIRNQSYVIRNTVNDFVLSETTSISDSLSALRSAKRILVATVQLGDVMAMSQELTMRIKDKINIKDSLKGTFTTLSTFPDSISVSDVFTKTYSSIKLFAETVVIYDALSRIFDTTKITISKITSSSELAIRVGTKNTISTIRHIAAGASDKASSSTGISDQNVGRNNSNREARGRSNIEKI